MPDKISSPGLNESAYHQPRTPLIESLLQGCENYQPIPICCMCDRFIDNNNLKGYRCIIGGEWVCRECNLHGCCELHERIIPDAFKARLFRLVKWDQISWEEVKLGCFGLFLLLMIVGSELDILSGIILWSSILLCVILFEFSFLNSQLKSRIHHIIENFDLNETGSDKEETQKEKGIMGNFNQHKGINRHDHYGFGKIETCGPQVVLENENILQYFFQNEIQRPRIPTAEDWTFIYRYLFIKVEMAKMLGRMVSVSTSWKAYGILKHFQPIRLVVCHYSVPELNARYIWDTNFRNGILQILREKPRWDRMN